VIESDRIRRGRGVSVSPHSQVRARETTLGEDVVIEDDVVICCDRLNIGDGTRLGAGSRVVAPEIAFAAGCRIGAGMVAELNEYFRLGVRSDIGRNVRIIGQGVMVGDHVWLTDDVVIGGGGARGPHSYLSIGDRSAIMDRCFINISEPVSIGADTALSVGVTVLTHSLWSPVLSGGTSVFAPTRIGSRNIVYVNAILAPGVTTGDDVTVAAGALVLQNVPDGSMAVGNPARIMKAVPQVPRELGQERRDTIVRDLLRGYAEALPTKGVQVEMGDDPDALVATFEGVRIHVRYFPDVGSAGTPADISLRFGDQPARSARCHFDLAARRMIGESSPLAEDLRDYLRRRTIRIFTDRPFQSLPPANIARLRALLRQA
jgi:acetyltransferase-like isoleucine patch superfamily enzyme